MRELEQAQASLDAALQRVLSEELERLSKALPAAIWERALIGAAREFLRRPGKQFRGRLLEAGWALTGGAPDRVPDELRLAVEVIHAGSLIVDDVQDGAEQRRGGPALHQVVGVPLALNTGGWLYFLPFSLVERAGLDAERSAALQRRMQRTMRICHEGQALDLALCVVDLDQGGLPAVVAETTARKTAALTELAAAMGALAAGAPPSRVEALATFGRELGTGLQMLDDLGSVTNAGRSEKGAEDLRGARPTWAWAWAAQQLDPGAYAELLGEARDVLAGASPVALAGRLAEAVGERGCTRAREQLEHAFFCLRSTCPASAELDAVERDFRRMEASYV